MNGLAAGGGENTRTKIIVGEKGWQPVFLSLPGGPEFPSWRRKTLSPLDRPALGMAAESGLEFPALGNSAKPKTFPRSVTGQAKSVTYNGKNDNSIFHGGASRHRGRWRPGTGSAGIRRLFRAGWIVGHGRAAIHERIRPGPTGGRAAPRGKDREREA